MNVEKNDVSLKPLFTWGRKFEIVDNNDNVVEVLYMRLVGDADLNRTRTYALRKSAEKRKALRTENSDERLAYIQEPGTVERERLVAFCSMFASKDLARDAVKNVTIPTPKEPKADATQEQQEIYQKEIDEYPGKLDAALRDYITTRLEALTKEYQTFSDDKLYELYVNYSIDELCEMEMYAAFKAMCTYYGTFKDEKFKVRYFESFDEFDNLAEDIKKQFISAYESLDMTPDELKKLRVATR